MSIFRAIPQQLRYAPLRILELLREETDAAHPLSTAQIEQLLHERWGIDAYRITIQNDIAALVAAGYEIETVRSTQNLYYINTDIICYYYYEKGK